MNQRKLLTICTVNLFSAAIFSSCAHKASHETAKSNPLPGGPEGLKAIPMTGPIEMKLKATLGGTEKVMYLHKALSKSYDDTELRAQKDENLEFTSEADTVKVDPDKFTQVVQVVQKDGPGEMHDFAMPDVGEKLTVTSSSQGRILKAGDYPPNSVFFVSPVSLPDGPVNIGDTWTMQASWLSLDEMVPFQLDMLSILKGLWECGKDRCAEVEIQGDVSLQGNLVKTMSFKSTWHGRIFFDLDAGTVVWSRVDSDEEMVAERVRRQISSCLEAVLVDPPQLKLDSLTKPVCVAKPATLDSQTVLSQ